MKNKQQKQKQKEQEYKRVDKICKKELVKIVERLNSFFFLNRTPTRKKKKEKEKKKRMCTQAFAWCLTCQCVAGR